MAVPSVDLHIRHGHVAIAYSNLNGAHKQNSNAEQQHILYDGLICQIYIMSIELTPEQSGAARRLVHNVLRCRKIQLFIGPGGSGKSTVMGQVVSELKTHGYETMFTTTSHSALGSCPGRGMVLAKLLYELKRKGTGKTMIEKHLDRFKRSNRRVLIFDEAFLETDKRLAELILALAGDTNVFCGGTKLILVGDPSQGKPIGGRPITSHPDVSAAILTELTTGTQRMTPDWAQDVSSFAREITLADASLVRFYRDEPPPGVLILTATRRDAIDITQRLAGRDAITITPLVPCNDDDEAAPQATSDAAKAMEPFILGGIGSSSRCRLVYNVSTVDRSRTTPGGFGLNNNALVRFAGLVDAKDGCDIPLEPGSSFVLTPTSRFVIRVEGELNPVVLRPHYVDGILVCPLRAGNVKTVHAAQGQTIKEGVHLYARGAVRQSLYVTAAGRVPSGAHFSVSRSVTRISPD